MIERYHAGMQLRRDRAFATILDGIQADPDCTILNLPEQILIHECVFDHYRTPQSTGKTFNGYDYRYVTFQYRDNIYYVQVPDLWPFDPAEVITYIRTGKNTKRQADYGETYKGLQHLKKNYTKYHGPLHGTFDQTINWRTQDGAQKSQPGT